MDAVFFGSIGTLAETSHLQLASYNEAFAAHGLDWHWSEDDYRSMLADAGGANRISAYAKSVSENVDHLAIHATKSLLFQQRLESGLQLRPGVASTILQSRVEGVKVGLVTTTSTDNVHAVLNATGLSRNDFDVILTRGDVRLPKPAPDAYKIALERMGVSARRALAIEDNPDGYVAARAAGLKTLAFAGAFHDRGAFPPGAAFVEAVEIVRYGIAA
ncbi:MAG: HAD-IA family hydrolase [Pseudomonadota bacterium]